MAQHKTLVQQAQAQAQSQVQVQAQSAVVKWQRAGCINQCFR